MTREPRMANDTDGRSERVFRMRGTEVSRLEAFSDAVLGFALTLLVISLEVPRSFDDLLDIFRGLPAFAICFALLIWVWHMHHTFFRRYGLTDRTTVFLNSVLLFIILVYVYPLKFLFVGFIGSMTGLLPGSQSGRAFTLEFEQMDELFVIYGSGFVALFFLFALLHLHALRRRAVLMLNRIEVFDTRMAILRMLTLAGIGALSIALALTLPSARVELAGWCYALIGATEFVLALVGSIRREKIV